jgi:hypothetical protein
VVIEFSKLPNPSSRIKHWSLLVSNRNEYQKHKKRFWRVEQGRLKADNFTAICDPIVYTMADHPHHLTTL